MVERGDRVLVACSGGPDSVCLLLCLERLRGLFGIRLEVLHVDHRLRPSSRVDAMYVRRLAQRLGVPFHLRTASGSPPAGASLEAWARGVRLAAIEEVVAETGAARAALGHTRNDQAETVLMAVISGGGLEALAGIPPVSGQVLHPLLEVSREEVEAFCRAAGVRPRLDETNRDPRYLRNTIRLEAIPAIERATDREIVAAIARSAELLRADADILAAQGEREAARLTETVGEGCRIDAAALASLPRPIASRVARAALRSLGAPWTQADIDAVLDLAHGRPGRRRDLSAGLLARRDRVYLSLSSRPSPESRG
jgi:tRNA(Ile)-lysidine synthase